MKSIKEITKIIVDFANERSWNNEDPSDLVTSVLVEFGELAEHFQWKHKFKELSEDEKLELGFEFVDVIFYLFRLAEKAGIDIEKYFDLKLPRLAAKFPVDAKKQGKSYKAIHDEYRKTGKNKRYE